MILKKEVVCPVERPAAPDNMTGLPVTFVEEILIGLVVMLAGISWMYMTFTDKF